MGPSGATDAQEEMAATFGTQSRYVPEHIVDQRI